jgi:hypothetical protein
LQSFIESESGEQNEGMEENLKRAADSGKMSQEH